MIVGVGGHREGRRWVVICLARERALDIGMVEGVLC